MKRAREEEAPADEPTKDEIYDRQLRLWGVQVQQRIGSAKVLVCGLSGTSSEGERALCCVAVHSVSWFVISLQELDTDRGGGGHHSR